MIIGHVTIVPLSLKPPNHDVGNVIVGRGGNVRGDGRSRLIHLLVVLIIMESWRRMELIGLRIGHVVMSYCHRNKHDVESVVSGGGGREFFLVIRRTTILLLIATTTTTVVVVPIVGATRRSRRDQIIITIIGWRMRKDFWVGCRSHHHHHLTFARIPRRIIILFLSILPCRLCR